MQPEKHDFHFYGMRWKLLFRQQPKKARMSGFAGNICRTLDPIPILEITPQQELVSGNPYPLLVAFAVLCDLDGRTIPEPRQTEDPKLVGFVSKECMLLMDENKVPGFFFPFADIGINCSGKFRLRFDLYDISMATSNRPVANIISDVIQVFSGQQFTGMENSTPIMNAFCRQGVKISQRMSRK